MGSISKFTRRSNFTTRGESVIIVSTSGASLGVGISGGSSLESFGSGSKSLAVDILGGAVFELSGCDEFVGIQD